MRERERERGRERKKALIGIIYIVEPSHDLSSA